MLIDALRERDSQQGDPGESVVIELVRLLTDRGTTDLASSAGELAAAGNRRQAAGHPPARLRGADRRRRLGGPGLAARTRLDPVAARLPGRGAPGPRSQPRASLYPKVEPLLHGLPAALSTSQQGGGDETRATIRRAAMNALTSVRGQEVPTFRALLEVRPRRTSTATPRSWPCRRFPRPTGPPRRPGRCSRASSPTCDRSRSRTADVARGARRAAARRRPGGRSCPPTGAGRSARSWASWASG